jgi:hypothetical protein
MSGLTEGRARTEAGAGRRAERSDDATADAALHLLAERWPERHTVEGVAREVGCAKARNLPPP